MLLGLGDFIYVEKTGSFPLRCLIDITYKDQECPDKNIGKIK